MNKEEFIKAFNDQSEQHITPSDWKTIMDASLKRDGDTKKLQIAQEELAELVQAISKYMRGTPDSNMLVLEELADVTIVISYVQLICGFNTEDLIKAINIKIEREKKRLERIEKIDELYGVGY